MKKLGLFLMLLILVPMFTSLFTFSIPSAQATESPYPTVTFSSGTLFRLGATNTNFTLSQTMQFRAVNINDSALTLFSDFSTHYYTDFCLWSGTSDTSFLISSWFISTSSTATLYIVSPTSTNIQLSLYSSVMVAASASGVVSQTYTSANKTLTMIVNTETNDEIIITIIVEETIISSPILLSLPLDEGTGSTAYDLSTYKNNGTIYGGASWVNGIFGKGLKFDGVNDYITIPNSESLNLGTEDWTINLWLQKDLAKSTDEEVILNKAGSLADPGAPPYIYPEDYEPDGYILQLREGGILWVQKNYNLEPSIRYNLLSYTQGSLNDSSIIRVANPNLKIDIGFETGANTTDSEFDSSGLFNFGIKSGDAARVTYGHIGNAIAFDGTGDYVKIYNSPSINIMGSKTYVIWFNATDVSTEQCLFSKYDLDMSLYILDSHIRYGVTTTTGGWQYISGSETLENNTWYCIIFSFDSEVPNITGYINNVLDASLNLTGSVISTTTDQLQLGIRNSVLNPYTGLEDEFKLYNKVLTSEERTLIYTSNKATWKGYVVSEQSDFKISDTSYISWYRGGFPSPRIGYATSTDGVNWIDSSSNPISFAPTIDDGCTQFPFVVRVGNNFYMFVGNTADASVYLFDVTNPTSPTPLNGGEPVLISSQEWESNTIYNVGVCVVGNTWYMLYEAGVGGGDYSLGYTYSTFSEMNWTINKSEYNPMFNQSCPYITYVPERNAFLVLQSKGYQYTDLVTNYAYLSDDLSLPSSWSFGRVLKVPLVDEPLVIGMSAETDAHMITTFNSTYPIMISYNHFQLDIRETFSEMTLTEFFDSILVNIEDWNMITVTNDGGILSIYFNSVLARVGAWDGNITNTYPLVISRLSNYNTSGYESRGWLNGSIDEIYILNMTLTPTQIDQIYHTPHNTGVNITNMDAGNWVFSQDKYYNFEAKYQYIDGINNLDTLKISFSDGVHWINVTYDNVLSKWGIDSGSDYIYLSSGTASNVSITKIITFPIFFKSTIFDCLDVDIYMWSNSTLGSSIGWELKALDYFNIYNLGGYNTLSSNGNAGRTIGGDIFELYAYNASSVQVVQYWKNLKSVDLFFDVCIYPTLFFEPMHSRYTFGIDYFYDGNWTNGLYTASIEISETSEYTSGSDTFVFAIEFYYKGVLIKPTEWINGFGFVNSTGTVHIPLHVELWFNKANASSLMGSRVTVEYYAMKDTANWFQRLFTGFTWGINDYRPASLMGFTTLRDDEGNIFSSQNLKLFRLTFNVTQEPNANPGEIISASNFNSFALDVNSPTMSGINTPVYVTPRTPNMAQGGLFSWLGTMFMSLNYAFASAFGPALLSFWNIFTGFMDTLFSWVGWPSGFSSMTSWIVSFGAWLVISMTYALTLLASMFTLMTIYLVQIIGMIVSAITGFVNIFTYLGWIWAQMGETVSPIFQFLTPLLQPTLIALVLIIWILSAKDMEGTVNRFRLFFGIMWKIIEVMLRIGEYTLNLVFRLIEAIPVGE